MDSTESLPAWSQDCHCGRGFSTPAAYTTHVRKCKTTRKRLATALERVKSAVKRRKTGEKLSFRSEPQVAEAPDDTAATAVNSGERAIGAVRTDRQPEAPAVQESLADWNLSSNRARRSNIQLPLRFRDAPPAQLPLLPPSLEPPSSAVGVAHSVPEGNGEPSNSSKEPTFSKAKRRLLCSLKNGFGLFRQYYATKFPDHDPEEHLLTDDLVDRPVDKPVSYGPFPNLSSFLLGEWWVENDRSSKSSFDKLIKIIGHPEFKPEDVAPTEWQKILDLLGRSESVSEEGASRGSASEKSEGPNSDGWHEAAIKVEIPFHKNTVTPGPVRFDAGCFHHRKLVDVIRDKITNPSAFLHLHFEPYKKFCQPSPDAPTFRVYDEIYTTDAFLRAHEELQNMPAEPGCSLPRVVAALMLSSDTTHFGDFSEAEVTPLYMGLGNESKDRRGKPSCKAYEHVAYFEKLPSSFEAFVKNHLGGKAPDAAFLAHCNREMRHAQWDILLDDEFLEAYRHGIVIACEDGISRRFYPRIFTYSADYPEKVLTAGLRNLGRCPCPRCLISLDQAHRMGMKSDMKSRQSKSRVANQYSIEKARRHIYEENYQIHSTVVEGLLAEQSLVPSYNAFTSKLAPLGFNIFQAMVVDQMHEVESGVWKSLFTHLLRILESVDGSLKHELDDRFRKIPPFGSDSVRKTTTNRSELKKMTAHSYENMLQCALPVFEGLLSEPHNSHIQNLLFDLAHFHGISKLGMHTDPSLKLMEDVIGELEQSSSKFVDETCSSFETMELEKELDRRRRREAKLRQLGRQPNDTNGHPVPRRLPKTFNRDTYKWHSLGDYPSSIRLVGALGSYSTERFELEHIVSKQHYRRTNGRSIPRDLSRLELSQRRIRKIRDELDRLESTHLSLSDSKSHAPACEPLKPYSMGGSQNTPITLPAFCQRNTGDPMVKDFVQMLKLHLLHRFQQKLSTGSSEHPTLAASNDGLGHVFIKKDTIYRHNLIHFHFTTYDVRRGSDVVNPNTAKCNIMLLAAPDEDRHPSHPFLYAKVLGAYHSNAVYIGPGMTGYEPERVDFLWVRWYEVLDGGGDIWKMKRQPSLQFQPIDSEHAYGFIDPADVLRGCHIVPNFAKGRSHLDGRGLSSCAKDGADYRQYYVGCFSERDLLMRYHWGMGVGHTYAANGRGLNPTQTTNVGEKAVGSTATINSSNAEQQEQEESNLGEEQSTRQFSQVPVVDEAENGDINDLLGCDESESEGEGGGSDSDSA